MTPEKLARLKQLKHELEVSKLSPMLLIDKFREAVLLTMELSIEQAEGGKNG